MMRLSAESSVYQVQVGLLPSSNRFVLQVYTQDSYGKELPPYD